MAVAALGARPGVPLFIFLELPLSLPALDDRDNALLFACGDLVAGGGGLPAPLLPDGPRPRPDAGAAVPRPLPFKNAGVRSRPLRPPAARILMEALL